MEYSVPNILRTCTDAGDSDYSWPGRKAVVEGVDLDKLNKTLGAIDYGAIRRRRNLYSRLYHEASISHHQGKGISFTDMLLLLAHHKLIVDKDALMSETLSFPLSLSTHVHLQIERPSRPNGDQQARHRSREPGPRAVLPQVHYLSPTLSGREGAVAAGEDGAR